MVQKTFTARVVRILASIALLDRMAVPFVAMLIVSTLRESACGQADFLDPVRVEFESHARVWADWSPVVSGDQLELYFTNDFQIVRSERGSVDERWGDPETIAELDAAGLDDGLALSHDGLTLIFGSSRDGGEGSWDLWQSTRPNLSTPWEPPTNLGPPINTRFSEGNASLSADGKTLYFASDGVGGSRAGGVGQSDIWISRRDDAEDSWGEPVNLSDGLGPQINTRSNEFYPSITPDDLHLYFTSTRQGGHGLEDVWVASRSAPDQPFGEPVNLGPNINTAQLDGTGKIAADGTLYYTRGVTRGQIPWELWVAQPTQPRPIALLPGDADQDQKFDQRDLIQVQAAAKYLTGQPATWGEGDWDGWDRALPGEPGNPPRGDGRFDRLDIIAALAPGHYLTGPYAVISPGGNLNDDQASIIYDPRTGELAVDAPADTELTSINIDSAASIFTGDATQNLGGSFDNDADDNIFKATFGSSFGSLSFGKVALAGLSEQFLLDDLTVIVSLIGGGGLDSVDLIFVPEQPSILLASIGALAILAHARFFRHLSGPDAPLCGKRFGGFRQS